MELFLRGTLDDGAFMDLSAVGHRNYERQFNKVKWNKMKKLKLLISANNRLVVTPLESANSGVESREAGI